MGHSLQGTPLLQQVTRDDESLAASVTSIVAQIEDKQ